MVSKFPKGGDIRLSKNPRPWVHVAGLTYTQCTRILDIKREQKPEIDFFQKYVWSWLSWPCESLAISVYMYFRQRPIYTVLLYMHAV